MKDEAKKELWEEVAEKYFYSHCWTQEVIDLSSSVGSQKHVTERYAKIISALAGKPVRYRFNDELFEVDRQYYTADEYGSAKAVIAEAVKSIEREKRNFEELTIRCNKTIDFMSYVAQELYEKI